MERSIQIPDILANGGTLIRTGGALERLAVKSKQADTDWIYDGLVGVFEDIKD